MSIKRSKQRTSGSSSHEQDEASTGLGAKKVEPPKVWADEVPGKDDAAFTPYAVSAKFSKGTLVLHSKFGKGLVVAVEGPRVEVLFEDGVKKLGHAG